MLEQESKTPKQGKKYQYLRIYNLAKISSRNHQVKSPEITKSQKSEVPKLPHGPEITRSEIHLVPNSPDQINSLIMIIMIFRQHRALTCGVSLWLPW